MTTLRPVGFAAETLCAAHRSGRVYGNACDAMCGNKNDGNGESLLIPGDCQTFHSGKEVVFQARYRGEEVFVKGEFVDPDSPGLHRVWTLNGDGRRVYPDLNDFEVMAERYLKDNLGIKLQGSIFQQFWGVELYREGDPRLLARAMDSAWSLLQSNEFVLSSLFQQFDLFPEVHGSCGTFYIVEKVTPLEVPRFLESQSFSDWAGKVKTALKLLDLLEELETVFEEGPLFLCDVKTQHFGLSRHGRAKVVDSDSTGFQSVIERSLGPSQNCTSHSECDFFDCRGRCDLVSERCAGEIVNNNLQAVCEDVFLPYHTNLLFEYPGLLSSKHMHRGLQNVLQTCANPSNSKEGIRLAADDNTRRDLKKKLREIVDIGKKLNDVE